MMPINTLIHPAPISCFEIKHSTKSGELCMDNELQMSVADFFFFFCYQLCRYILHFVYYNCLHAQEASYWSRDLQASNQLRSRQSASCLYGQRHAQRT